MILLKIWAIGMPLAYYLFRRFFIFTAGDKWTVSMRKLALIASFFGSWIIVAGYFVMMIGMNATTDNRKAKW